MVSLKCGLFEEVGSVATPEETGTVPSTLRGSGFGGLNMGSVSSRIKQPLNDDVDSHQPKGMER